MYKFSKIFRNLSINTQKALANAFCFMEGDKQTVFSSFKCKTSYPLIFFGCDALLVSDFHVCCLYLFHRQILAIHDYN